MPQEFIPRDETVLYQPQMFGWINTFLDYAEKMQLSQELISDVLGAWPMPNSPILSEN